MSEQFISRTDDTAATLRKIATNQYTDGSANTVEAQVVGVADKTTPTQQLAVNSGGAASVIAAANSGVDIGDTTINNASGAAAVNVQDGGNSLTVDNAALSVTGGGVEATALRVTLASDSTGVVSVDDNSGSLTVDNAALSVTGGGAEATALRVTLANDSTGVVSVDDNAGSLTVDNAALSVTGGGAEATAMRVTLANDSTGVVSVDDNGSSLTVDGTVSITANSAVNMAQVGGTNTVTGGTAGSQGVGGIQAHDAADSSNNPVKVGVKTIAHGANPTAVAAADVTDLYANRAGVLFVIGGHPNVVCSTYITTGAQTDDNVLAAISAGTKYVLTRVSVYLDQATTVGTAVRLGFGASVVPALGASGADAVAGILCYHPGLVPGSGFQIGDGSGIIGIGGDGEELRVTCGAPTTGTLVVSTSHYTIES